MSQNYYISLPFIRSSMSSATLCTNMKVNLLTPSIKEFDAIPSIRHWQGCGRAPRRPFFLDEDPRPSKKRRLEEVKIGVTK